MDAGPVGATLPKAPLEGSARSPAAAASPRAVLDRLRASLPAIQARAPDLDERRAFPTEDVALLRRIGALEAFVGAASSTHELMEALRLVGRANLSLGRIFEGHINGAALVRLYGDATQRQRLARDLGEGRVFGVWNTQPPPGVDVIEAGGRPVLRGRKSYATGAGYIDRAIVTAASPRGERQMFLVDASDRARADDSSWRTRGMRATLSGVYDLTGVPADETTRLGKEDDYIREPVFTGGAWRFTAVQLGGVERVVSLLREHLFAGAAADQPLHRARFAAAVTAMRSAYMWVREAATRAERPGAGPDDLAFVLMTRGVVENAGLEVMEIAARCVGARGFFTDNPLDLACRDLSLYLRQSLPDPARDEAARAFIARDCWSDDRLW